ncbi:MAG: hypothetical protein RIM23_07855 [Coleofasciculus sp. G3-WIS-01]|uniref:hypothetical protein n=1 Tax=Coleofasciculus sp. G3-WIS-01 TaxID=3069528 RepID=UPI0032FEC20E
MTINQSLQHIGYWGAIASFLFIPCNPVLAQITPDSTLGSERSSILPDGVVIDGVTADLIQDGASRGSALFHSFLEFNINQGQRVYFANPVVILSYFPVGRGRGESLHYFSGKGINCVGARRAPLLL